MKTGVRAKAAGSASSVGIGERGEKKGRAFWLKLLTSKERSADSKSEPVEAQQQLTKVKAMKTGDLYVETGGKGVTGYSPSVDIIIITKINTIY